MSKTNKSKPFRKKLLKYTWVIIAVWTSIMAGFLVRDMAALSQNTRNLAVREARVHFKKDEAFRYWAATHGGFYVPADERTPPNPYLTHIFERDIETPSGVQLTLMNPAYALRQMNEEFTEIYGTVGHLTSLRPLNPENAPDEWERQTLKSFENGETEAVEITDIQDLPFLRLMRPLITQEGCLKCHGHQGYVVGDIRGGVSVSVPLASFLAEEQQAVKTHILPYVLLWVLGFGIIIQGSRIIKKKNDENEHAKNRLQKSHEYLEKLVQERTVQLTESNRELKKYHKNLEKLVEERTAEVKMEILKHQQAEVELQTNREQLEEIVKVRTEELEERNKELDKAMKVFVGREIKIRELQNKIKELEGA